MVLKDFMFKNLLKNESVFCRNPPAEDQSEFEAHRINIQKIRHSIINYLYSGCFELKVNKDNTNSFSDDAVIMIKKQDIENNDTLTPESFFQSIEGSWENIIKVYNTYLETLRENMEKSKTKISKIIVYEAPPYNDSSEVNQSNNYFLTNESSNYYTPIKKCFDPQFNETPIELLVRYQLVFFDISIVGLPLSKGDIRKKWNKDDNFKIGTKQLTIVLFEIAFEHFIKQVGIGKIAEHPLFAIGAPVNSSTGIFEYYSHYLLNVYENNVSDLKFEPTTDNDIRKISADLGITNTTTTFIKRNAYGETFPLYKSNIINSGYPSSILMKNAFNMEID